MKCIVGLGNPGEKYEHNRHNVGFMVMDKLGSEWEFSKKFNAEMVQTKEYILVKPQTFMNDSGSAVSKITRFYKIKYEDLYIVHDDLDIPIGGYKVQFGKGPQVHNGLLSIEADLGTDQFWNVRVGVENREIRGNKGVPGMVYSLQDFRKNERETVDGIITQICRKLISLLSSRP